MELDELILLSACALLGGRTFGGFSKTYEQPSDREITDAVRDASRVWHAVLAAK